MPFPPTSLLLAGLMAGLALSITIQDWRTTHVALWKLCLLLLLAGLFAAAHPFPATARIEHLIGAIMGGGVGASVGWVVGRRMGRIAFGGADSWILTAGGAALGMQWVGPWIGASVMLGLGAFVLGVGRADPEGDDGHAVLPFAPILLVAFLAILAGRLLEWLPARPF